MKFLIYPTLILSFLLVVACKDEPAPPNFHNEAFFDCNREMRWDTTVITNTLVGDWEWKYIRCFWNPEDANNTQFKDLAVSFHPDGSLMAINNLDTTIGSWKVVEIFSDDHTLELEPSIEQLDGNIIICGNEVLFFNSYIDGCDNFFRKNN